jgi:D-alanyl-D-alanine carboxypeptidase
MISKVFLASIITFATSFGGGNFLVNIDTANINSADQVINQTNIGPDKKSLSLGVDITAKAGIITDLKSSQILFEKNKNDKLPMASLTKIMTAVILLDSEVSMEDTYTVEQEVMEFYGSDIDLEVGEEITVNNLLHGLLINSGNDAAMAIARKVGKTKENFVKMMNQKAQDLGMNNTMFHNPHGLDYKDHYASASDLAILAAYAYQKPIFRQIIRMKDFQFDAENIVKHHQFKNTNQLLHEDYFMINGGKTGFTDNAQYCLIAYGSDKNKHEIITVILGSPEDGMQFHDTKAMIEWTYGNYHWGK